MSEPAEVLRLRECRAELERVEKQLDAALTALAKAEEKVADLRKAKREAWAERDKAIVAAHKANVAKARIAAESGVRRPNVYKVLEKPNVSEDT